MKKRFALAFAAVIALCLALVGCGGSDSADNKANFVGTWEVYEMQQGDEIITSDDVAILKESGYVVTLELGDDGSFSFDMGGDVSEGTWEATSATEAKATVDGQEILMMLEDGKLTMTQDGSDTTITFVRAEDAS